MKRKNMGEFKFLYPVIGKTVEEARAWLAEADLSWKGWDLTSLRSVSGPHFLDQQPGRVNVITDDAGKIVKVEGVG